MKHQLVHHQVDAAVNKVRELLVAERAGDAHGIVDVVHTWTDKYHLASQLGSCYASGLLDVFSSLGLTGEHLKTARKWSAKKADGGDDMATFLCVRVENDVTFVREATRDEEDPKSHQVGFGVMSIKSKTVTKITEYFYNVKSKLEIYVRKGTGQAAGDRITLSMLNSSTEVIRKSKSAPSLTPVVDVSAEITTFLRCLHGESEVEFVIDRSSSKCHTPVRNPQSEAMSVLADELHHFGELLTGHFSELLSFHNSAKPQPEPDVSPRLLSISDHFVPIFPLMFGCDKEEMQHRIADGENLGGPVVFTSEEILTITNSHSIFLSKYCEELCASVRTVAPYSLYTSEYAKVHGLVLHGIALCIAWSSAMSVVENAIRQLLVRAIGKHVTTRMLDEYMDFHFSKLMLPSYVPKPFNVSVRQSLKHSPEGAVRLLTGTDSNVYTMSWQANTNDTSGVRQVPPMSMPLNESTCVTLLGSRHAHLWMTQGFEGHGVFSVDRLRLVIDSNKFSSFVFVLGTLSSGASMKPQYAFIVKDGSQLTLPLEASALPSAVAFRDAISSLSPEQQDFAKAIRSMQLESTLFTVAMIQIRPQLEKVLSLPTDTLTKEIKLTQHLMQLFIKHQIPSDLLAYDGDEKASVDVKISSVSASVKAVNDLISELEDEEVSAQKKMREYNGVDSHMEIEVLQSPFFDDDESDTMSVELPAKPKMKKQSRMFGGLMRSSRGGSAPTMLAMAAEPCSVSSAPPPAPTPASSAPVPSTPASSAPVPSTPATIPESSENAPTEYGVSTFEFGEQVEYYDLSKLPKDLESKLLSVDKKGAVSPLVISSMKHCRAKVQRSLLTPAVDEEYDLSTMQEKTKEAFNLLDALTKSGGLPIDFCSVHVLLGFVHQFDKSVMDTVVQDNVNPIMKIQDSLLGLASTVFDVAPQQLTLPNHPGLPSV